MDVGYTRPGLHHAVMMHWEARQGKARQGKARQGKAGQQVLPSAPVNHVRNHLDLKCACLIGIEANE